MTKAEALEITKLLASSYPTEGKWSPERVKIWLSMLADLPAPAVQASAKAWITTQKWPPAISEIRELATGAASLPSAAEAWGEVMALVQAVGSWGTPDFSSEIIGRAVESMGGWQALCASENAMADRAHFLKIFDQLANREVRDRKIAPDVRWLLSEASKDIGQMPKELEAAPPARDSKELVRASIDRFAHIPDASKAALVRKIREERGLAPPPPRKGEKK